MITNANIFRGGKINFVKQPRLGELSAHPHTYLVCTCTDSVGQLHLYCHYTSKTRTGFSSLLAFVVSQITSNIFVKEQGKTQLTSFCVCQFLLKRKMFYLFGQVYCEWFKFPDNWNYFSMFKQGICNNKGECKCGECVCNLDTSFKGTTCEVCPVRSSPGIY